MLLPPVSPEAQAEGAEEHLKTMEESAVTVALATMAQRVRHREAWVNLAAHQPRRAQTSPVDQEAWVELAFHRHRLTILAKVAHWTAPEKTEDQASSILSLLLLLVAL